MRVFPVLLYLMLASFQSCNNEKAERSVQPGGSGVESKSEDDPPDPGSRQGIYMEAVIAGKKWVAVKMIPDYSENSNYKMIHGETDRYAISFNIYKPKAGDQRNLGEEYMINLVTDEGYFSGKTGEVKVTMADEYWIEGNFRFTATSSQSTEVIEVTDGFFRVSVKDPERSK